MTKDKIIKTRAPFVFFGGVSLFFLGLIYAFSMFVKPIMEDFLLQGEITYVFNVMIVMFGLGSLIGSWCEKNIGVKYTLLLACVLYSAAFVGTGMLAQIFAQAWVLYVLYAGIGGLGVGIAYNTTVGAVNLWFPDKLGFISGIQLLCFGASSLIFGNLSLLARPYIGGMSSVFIFFGIFGTIAMLLFAFFYKNPPADIVEVMMGKQAASKDAMSDGDSIITSANFWVYFVWVTLITVVGLSTIGNASSDAMSIGISEAMGALLVGFVSAVNGGSRVVIGFIYDKFGVVCAMGFNNIIGIIAAVCVLVGLFYGHSIVYIIGALLCGFSYGSIPVIGTAFVRQRYGALNYAFNRSVVIMTLVAASILNIIMGLVTNNDRLLMFSISLGFCIFSLILVFIFAGMWKKWQKKGA